MLMRRFGLRAKVGSGRVSGSFEDGAVWSKSGAFSLCEIVVGRKERRSRGGVVGSPVDSMLDGIR